MRLALGAVMLGLAAPALADPLAVRTTSLACDRGVSVPVVFVSGPEDAVAVLQIEGRQILLYQEPAASGVRYAWPSDGAGYVLLSKGDAATILWREAGVELPMMTCLIQA